MKKEGQTNAGIFCGSIELQDNKVIIKEDKKMKRNEIALVFARMKATFKKVGKIGFTLAGAKVEEHLFFLRSMYTRGNLMTKESIRTRIKDILDQISTSKFDPSFLLMVQKFADSLMPEIFKQNRKTLDIREI